MDQTRRLPHPDPLVNMGEYSNRFAGCKVTVEKNRALRAGKFFSASFALKD